MHKFYTLLVREVRSYFHSPIAYVVLIFFLLVAGVDFYFQVSFMNQRQVQYTVQEAFFNSVFFWFAFVLIFPLITMRLFAEEFKLGTIEPLTTVPVRDWQVVLSKFFGALIFYLILWVPTLLYFWIFLRVTNQSAAHSAGAYFGSYLMLLLLGMFYLSIGCLTSVHQEPNHRRRNLFLRDYAVIFSWSGSVHSFGYHFDHARLTRLFLRDRTHGNILPRRNRYPADRSLREHDHCDANAHLSGIPIPQMEALTNGC